MHVNRPTLALMVFAAALLAACSSSPEKYLADAGRRAEVIDRLATDAAMRQETLQRLLASPAERTAVLAMIIENEEVSAELLTTLMKDDRGKAIVAGSVASDTEVARSFMRMLMLTGVVGELMSQEQAERIHLGEAYAYGNQRKTMSDLKRLGEAIDGWAGERGGRYPVCTGYDDVGDCLIARLPSGSTDSLTLNDAWGRSFLYHSNEEGTLYTLLSYATDGQYDNLGNAGPTASYDCDIVFSNGRFVQWPGRIRPESVR